MSHLLPTRNQLTAGGPTTYQQNRSLLLEGSILTNETQGCCWRSPQLQTRQATKINPGIEGGILRDRI